MALEGSFVSDQNTSYPALGFRFNVTFNWVGVAQSYPFQSVANIKKGNNVEKINNGGDNTRQYSLPSYNTYEELKLVRGLMKRDWILRTWLENFGLSLGKVRTAQVVVELRDIDKNNNIIKVEDWTFYNCYPTSFEIGELNAQNYPGEVLLETVTLAYSRFERGSVIGPNNYYPTIL